MNIKELSDPAKTSIWFAASNIARKLILYVSMPVFTRLLTTEQYGIYTLYCSWSEIIFLFTTLSISSNVYNKCFIKYRNEIWQFTSSILFLTVVTSTIVGVFCIGGYPILKNIVNLPLIVILFIIVDSIFSPAFNYWAVTQKYEYKYKWIVIYSLLQTLLNPIMGVFIVIKCNGGGVGRCASVVAANSIINIPMFIWIVKQGKCLFKWSYWKYVLISALPLIPHYLSQILLNQMDRIMIGKICGISHSAIYSVAYSISIASLIINRAVNDSYTPWLYTKLKNCNYANVAKVTNRLIFLIAIMDCLIILGGPEIISILGTSEYKSAIWVIPPVAVSAFLLFVYALFCNIEFYYEVSKYMTIVSIIVAAINYILNYMFIPIFGFIAAAYTTLFCYMIFVILHYCIMKKTLHSNGIEQLYDDKLILRLMFLMIGGGIGINVLYLINLVRYAVFIIIVLVLVVNSNFAHRF